MVLAARFSAERGLMPMAEADRIARHIASVELPADLAALRLNVSGAQLAAHMLHDKKVDAGRLAFLLMRGIGEAFLIKDVTLDEVSAFLERQLRG